MNRLYKVYSDKLDDLLNRDISEELYKNHKYNVADPIVEIIVTKPFTIFDDHGDDIPVDTGDKLWITGMYPDVYDMQLAYGQRVWGKQPEVDANTDFMNKSVTTRLRNLLQLADKKIHLTPEEYAEVDKRFGDESKRECSFARDKDGYYCYTHRARSKSYETISKIPFKDYNFICSTG